MNLLLQRHPTVHDTTLGELFVDGVNSSDTLEDAIREVPGEPVASWKIPGQTAIPAGRYPLKLVDSQRFGPDTISIEDVPGFDAIRIHGGNWAADTHGCVLVGTADPNGGSLAHSQLALKALKAVLVPRLKAGEDSWIEVRNP